MSSGRIIHDGNFGIEGEGVVFGLGLGEVVVEGVGVDVGLIVGLEIGSVPTVLK
jgi:hypothetical protein